MAADRDVTRRVFLAGVAGGLTIPRLLRADRLFCIVPGSTKLDAIRRTLYGPIAINCPASILRQQAHCTLYLDAESDPDAER